MKKLTRFFWFCSGVHQETLKKYPAEHNKYVGIGATIFFTGLFAALSGGYAMYFVFSGSLLAIPYALVFGLIWGLAIFNLDRYIVSTLNKNQPAWRQLLQATPRILLAILIGIVISRPLELKIFDKEIRERLRVTYLEQQRAKIDTLNVAFDNKYRIDLDKLEELKVQRDSSEAAIKAARLKLSLETFGEKTPETSGIVGYGPYAQRRQAELDKEEQYLDTLRAYIQHQEAFIQQRKEFDGLLGEKLLTGARLDSAVNVAGFADRNSTLGQLRYRPDGSEDEATQWAIVFVMLLFIFFECLPVFVKLMSTRDAYDVALQDQQIVDFHHSGKDRDAEIEITDGVYDTRVQQAIEKRKAELWQE